jgi:hypothetical protein
MITISKIPFYDVPQNPNYLTIKDYNNFVSIIKWDIQKLENEKSEKIIKEIV